MLSKKSFAGIYEKFLKLLMRSMRGDVRDHNAPRKTTADFRTGTPEHRSGGVVQKPPIAGFLASFDFRLFRQHRPVTDIPRFGEECQSFTTCAGLEVGTEAGGPKPLSLALRRSTSQTAQRIFLVAAVGSTAPRSSSVWRDGFCGHSGRYSRK